MVRIKLTILILLTTWTISCKQKDVSGIERIIVDEAFIKSKTTEQDSMIVDSSKGYKLIATTYYLKNSQKVVVVRDSLNKIRSWWLRNNKEQNIEGAEVSRTTRQILGKVHFTNGVINGEVKYYYDDGRIKSKGQFKNGNWRGEWKNYDKNGNLVSINNYNDNGKPTKE